MNRILSLLAVVLVSSVTFANAGEVKSPSLVGAWSGSYAVSFLNGTGHSSVTVVVTSQVGANFNGYMDWKRHDVKMSRREPFAGVVDFDGKTLIMVQEDGGTARGKVTGANTMQFLMWQGGMEPKAKTLAYRANLVRK